MTRDRRHWTLVVPAALTLLTRARRRIRSGSDALLLLRVAVVMTVLPLATRMETTRMLQWLERLGAVLRTGLRAGADDVVGMARSCGGLHVWAFQDNCVAQSLTLFTLLNRRPAPLAVVFGVEALAPSAGTPRLGRRHVWLERDGQAVYEREALDLTRYLVQFRYRGEAPEAAAEARTSRSLLRALSLSSGSSGLIGVAAIVRTKIVAVVLGPAGVAIAGQVSQALLAMTWIATVGTGAGTTRYLSEALGRRDRRAAVVVIRTSALLLAGACLVLAAGLALFAPQAATTIFGTSNTVHWLWWLIASMPMAAVLSVTTAILRGAGCAERLAAAQGAGALLAVLASSFLMRGATVDALAPLALVVLTVQAAAVAIAAWPIMRQWRVADTGWFDPALAGRVGGYGLANVVMGIASAASTLYIGRSYLAVGLQTESGHIAALAWFADPLASAFVSGLSATCYPAYCAADPDEAPSVLSRSLRAFVMMTAPVLAVGALVAHPLLRLLFSPAFQPLAVLLPMQLLATYLRSINVLLGIPLLARGRVVPLTLMHLGWAALSAAMATYGLGGSHAYVAGMLAAGCVQSAVLLMVLNAVRLAPTWRDLAWLAGGALAVLCGGLL